MQSTEHNGQVSPDVEKTMSDQKTKANNEPGSHVPVNAVVRHESDCVRRCWWSRQWL